ncbi:MAG: hypothetical protein PHU44_05260 [Syntrophales bacterium]|nr:hypothetical protein [Syntrophales bacterium]MDD5641284.1 hypothetical protein [Syntrophales bacterium]
MDETSVRGVNFFQSTDVKAVKEALSSEDIDEVQKHVKTLITDLDELVNILHGGGLFLKNGRLSTGRVAFAAFRIETLSLIFECARKYIQKSSQSDDLYKAFLNDLGHEVGFTYGRELLNNLRISQSVPIDDFALIELWALFENETGAGVTTIHKIDVNTYEITLKNNPIGFFYGDNGEHHHCQFYCEYYRAILNEFLTTRPRLARDFIQDYIPKVMKVISVKEKPRKGRCVFEIKLREEQLTGAFDMLHVALTEMDEEKYGEAVSAAREALVEAQKEKLFSGIDPPRLIYKGFQGLLSKRDFKLMDDSYQRACGIVHRSKRKDVRGVREIIRHIRYCIHEIERMDIDETKLKEIRESLLR